MQYQYFFIRVSSVWIGGSISLSAKSFVALLCVLLGSGLARAELLPTTEYVLTEGMNITARTPSGVLTITGGPGAKRTFSGEGWKKTADLIPRRTRWYGSLGLYDPAASFSPHGRLLVDEGRQFFDSESEALRYLYGGSTYFQPVFNNSGLVVGYHIAKIPGGDPARSVQVWQIYIKGRKPTSLRGADDSAVQMTGGKIPATASSHPAPVGYERALGKKEYVPGKPANASR